MRLKNIFIALICLIFLSVCLSGCGTLKGAWKGWWQDDWQTLKKWDENFRKNWW